MIFEPTAVDGAWLVRPERHHDDRGSFARTYCVDEFAAHGIDFRLVQSSVSFNTAAGTLRGMHFQVGEEPEHKLVRCTRGRIFDVAVDIRPDSPTYGRWAGFELGADDGDALFVPAGCAHGFVTLEPSTEVAYSIGARFTPAGARGVRWDDPAFGIEWPVEPAVISERDAGFADFAR